MTKHYICITICVHIPSRESLLATFKGGMWRKSDNILLIRGYYFSTLDSYYEYNTETKEKFKVCYS